MTPEMTTARIAENQSRFRRANEQIELAADSQELYGIIPFLCECPRVDCLRIVQLTMVEYEQVREKPERFFTAPGHQVASVDSGDETVVEDRDSYVVVDKIGVAADIAALRFAELQVSIAPDITEDHGGQ
jgi:hypothetical protein